MSTIIKTSNLSKVFSNQMKSVNDLSISVKEGEIYGFLGSNGAGKSTTMKMLLGLMKPSGGIIEIFQKNLAENTDSILFNTGSLIEEPSYYGNLTGYENLEIMQKLLNFPKSNINEALEIVRLEKHKNKLVKNYSLGMKQRLGIALAIVKFPKLLILDEPTNGLDPAGIQEMRELIRSLPRKYGMTVMISSHLLSEIEQIATTVGIIDQGKLIYEGSLSNLEDDGSILIKVNNPIDARKTLIKESYKIIEIKENDLILPIYSNDHISKIIKCLVKNEISIYEVKKIKKSLENIFLEITSRGGVL
ncbi:putative bacitracin transporter ATP-binding protein [Gottschalkia acidurici 9a]|uniref:Bacitracin transporter ATP-binding protein n=1 Tax=Gottschalkia acidurici (strain ATCC 7906 / DSM 604 / BCRC 14475 / CIP 104303 / KCTC 5404 / NCIMB 10678 / 9a) TaxID=1128398 RepID=K0B2L4_GOTA9|nr:ABC transporter ATP-binding protein [Gottschalkia acidurici]AFS79739.1 putative bacitracin transporter ATP-binding protein [Gottschalkia acidurici 9a]